MTSILHYRDPIAYRSDFMNTPNYHSPLMDQPKKSPPYDGHSSGSEAKNQTPGLKKRPSRAGTRSVTTLTAAQLERKRANDREAQRAIRQRTKDHIDTLERQVRDLNAQLENNSSTKMMELMRRNEELEQENAVLRARLSHAVSALGVPEQGAGKSELIPRLSSARQKREEKKKSTDHLFHHPSEYRIFFLLFGVSGRSRFRCSRASYFLYEITISHPLAHFPFSPVSFSLCSIGRRAVICNARFRFCKEARVMTMTMTIRKFSSSTNEV